MPTQALPLLLGHRGCRLRGFRENSIPAFTHALDSGCDGFEFDVRLTRDGRAICIHDSHIGKDDVGSSAYEELLNHGLECPLLPDILARFASTAFLNIELKVPGLEEITLQAIRAHPPARGYFISSFIPEVICEIAEIAPRELGQEAELGYLFDTVSGLHAWPNMPGPWVVLRHDLVTRQFVDSVHSAGRKVMAWTVNRPLEMSRLVDWGVDGIISDAPASLCRVVRGAK